MTPKLETPNSESKEEIIKLDEFEWNDSEHKEKQARFQESLKRSSEIVSKWPEWKQNILGTINKEVEPVYWKYAKNLIGN